MIKISGELKPFKRYIVAASSLVPLKKIKSIIVQKKKNSKYHGMWDAKRKSITIYNLHTMTFEDVLHTLAHELAHVVHFEHTPAHFRLMSLILLMFSFTMSQYGVDLYDE